MSTTRRWSQTARQSAANRSKWVRLPPASLTNQLPVRTTSFCEREPCLSYSFVGRSQDKPNCLSRLHRNYDDPKVANLERSRERERTASPGDGLACAHCRKRKRPIRADISATTSLGILKHGDCRLGVHRLRPVRLATAERLAGSIPVRKCL